MNLLKMLMLDCCLNTEQGCSMKKEHQRDAETYTSRTQQSYRHGRYGGLSTADCKNLQLQSSRHQQLVQPLSADRPGTRPSKIGKTGVTTPAEDRYIRTIHLRFRDGDVNGHEGTGTPLTQIAMSTNCTSVAAS